MNNYPREIKDENLGESWTLDQSSHSTNIKKQDQDLGEICDKLKSGLCSKDFSILGDLLDGVVTVHERKSQELYADEIQEQHPPKQFMQPNNEANQGQVRKITTQREARKGRKSTTQRKARKAAGFVIGKKVPIIPKRTSVAWLQKSTTQRKAADFVIGKKVPIIPKATYVAWLQKQRKVLERIFCELALIHLLSLFSFFNILKDAPVVAYFMIIMTLSNLQKPQSAWHVLEKSKLISWPCIVTFEKLFTNGKVHYPEALLDRNTQPPHGPTPGSQPQKSPQDDGGLDEEGLKGDEDEEASETLDQLNDGYFHDSSSGPRAGCQTQEPSIHLPERRQDKEPQGGSKIDEFETSFEPLDPCDDNRERLEPERIQDMEPQGV